MISLAILKPEQAAKYFEKDNYYSREANKERSEWLGKGAKLLDLHGAIELKEFSNLCYGKTPDGKKTLVQIKPGMAIKRAGFDVCFSAPKTVTLMALIAGDERLVEAHKTAVRKAMEVAEARYAQARVGGQKDRQIVSTRNLVVAAFDHNTSREKDPQLHTHCCVLNMTKRSDDKWRSVFCDPFWNNGKLLGTLYQNELACRVRELGYQVETKPNGTFEIAGIPKDIIKHFSKRTAKIEALECQSKAEERVAKLKIRPPKGKSIPTEKLKEFWHRRLNTLGERLPAPAIEQIEKRDEFTKQSIVWSKESLRAALKHLGERQVAFKSEKAEIAALAKQLGHCSWNDLQNACSYLRKQREILPTKDGRWTTMDALELEGQTVSIVKSGKNIHKSMFSEERIAKKIGELSKLNTDVSSKVYSDLNDLYTEKNITSLKILPAIQARLKTGVRLERQEVREFRTQMLNEISSGLSIKERKILSKTLTHVLESAEGLTQGQREALVKTLQSPDRVVAWQGVAGAGKSFALREIQELCAKEGYIVRGFAPSADAAIVLENEAKIKSDTLASLLSKPLDITRNKKNIWVIDEAGLMGQRDCFNLLKRAEACDAKVVLVGDSRQLPSVEAGAAFRFLLENGVEKILLNESRRQKDESLEKAVELMAKHQVTDALMEIKERIVERKTAEKREALCAQSFLSLKPELREKTLVLASTNKERESIISGIRAGLLQEGRLVHENSFSILAKKDLTKVQRQMAYNYSDGDILETRTGKNTRWFKVISSDSISNTVTMQDTHGNFRIASASDLINSNTYISRDMKIAEGDKLRWTRNDREKCRTNGQEFQVQKIEKDGILVRYKTGEIEKVPLPEFKHIDYSWVQTKYAAQGKTCDNVLIVANENINRNALYVAMTRAKYDLKIFVDDREKFIGRSSRSGDKEIAHEVVEPTFLSNSRDSNLDKKADERYPDMDI